MKTILVDVMVDGRFYTQVRYTKHGIPQMINGEIKEVHDADDINKFVLEKRPSLKGKNYKLSFASQKIFR